ncbi:MAG: NAD(P)-dependent oxidoreductase [Candidatus Hadarchaeota archaeon]
MNLIKILVTEPESCHEDYLALLKKLGKVTAMKMSRRELLEKVAGYDVLVVGVETVVDKSVIDRAKKLKIVGSNTTGTDHIDVKYAESKGIKLITLRGATHLLEKIPSTAEHTFALILSLVRKIPWAFDSVRREEWVRKKFFGRELNGKTLGIVGFGRLGKKVAAYGKAFGMKVIAHDPFLSKSEISAQGVKPVDLKTILKESDVISIHIHLSKETEGMVGLNEFKQMKKNPILINTSRGRIVDESALLKALQKGLISGAALDVLVSETLKENPLRGNPLVKYSKKHDNLLITPHLGGTATEALRLSGLYVGKKINEEIKSKFF